MILSWDSHETLMRLSWYIRLDVMRPLMRVSWEFHEKNMFLMKSSVQEAFMRKSEKPHEILMRKFRIFPMRTSWESHERDLYNKHSKCHIMRTGMHDKNTTIFRIICQLYGTPWTSSMEWLFPWSSTECHGLVNLHGTMFSMEYFISMAFHAHLFPWFPSRLLLWGSMTTASELTARRLRWFCRGCRW